VVITDGAGLQVDLTEGKLLSFSLSTESYEELL
jgi:hypothetical protein